MSSVLLVVSRQAPRIAEHEGEEAEVLGAREGLVHLGGGEDGEERRCPRIGALGGGLASFLGETGALIVGVALLVAGVLLFTGASAGALLRRSGTAMRRADAAGATVPGAPAPPRSTRMEISRSNPIGAVVRLSRCSYQ